MNFFYTFGFSNDSINVIKKINKNFLKKNIFIFRKKNFFLLSNKKITEDSIENIYIFVIGKIFNRRELIKNLNKGIEKNLIINIYKKFGYEKLISLIDGDVQILIYDLKKELIFFNNSKFGVMPCYFYDINNEIFFSNSIKNLAHINNAYKLNNEYIKRFLGFHYRQIENQVDTPLKKIKKLQPSFYINYKLKKNGNLFIKKKWYLIQNKSEQYNNWNENELCEKLIYLINRSIKKRIPNKNFFCSLSGGLDSSTLVALINKIAKVDAATISYNDQTYDEVDDIKTSLRNMLMNGTS